MEMIIFLGWNCFVRPLMQVAGSDGMMMQIPATPMRCGQLLHETPQVTILQRPQDQMPVIRHEAIAQNTHKNFGLSFCQVFFERGRVRNISENPIPGISTVEYVKKHSPQRLTCCSWHDSENIPRKLPFSTMIWPHPVASTCPSCLCSPDCVTWEYQGHPQGKYAEN
jgi:hypothetical protein